MRPRAARVRRTPRAGNVESPTLFEALTRCLEGSVSAITAQGIVRSATRRAGLTQSQLDSPGQVTDELKAALLAGVAVFGVDEAVLERCRARLEAIDQPAAPRPWTVRVENDQALVDARNSARQLAGQVGFGHTDQIKIATIVSELLRNTLLYAGGGEISVGPTERARGIRIVVRDHGPGIADVDHILSGGYRSKTGMGLGLLGCKRLMDSLEIDSSPQRGTTIEATKYVA